MKHWGALALVVLSACRGTLSDEELLRMASAAAAAREGGMAAQDAAAEASDRIPVRLDDSGAVRHTKALDGRFDAARMLQVVADLEGLRRETGNDDYERAIELIIARLQSHGFGTQDGLELQVHSQPRTVPGWNARAARLELLPRAGTKDTAVTLAAFQSSADAQRLLLPTNAPSAAVEGPIVTRMEDVVPGSVLVGAEPLSTTRLEEAKARGAVLVIAADAAPYTIDPSGQARHMDAIGYRSVRHPAVLPVAQVSPRMLEQLVKHTGQVRWTAEVTWTERPLRTVIAVVVGDRYPNEEVAIAAHVQEPGACDNASGVAGTLEMAAALADLARDGARPARSVAFVFGDEMDQSRVHLQTTQRRVVAAIAADMLGESHERTGAVALLERAPDPGALRPLPPDAHTAWGAAEVQESQFASGALAVAVRQAFYAVAASEAQWQWNEHPFEGGSDHIIYLKAGVPAVLVWHFPDWTYHTSLDRLDMVDAEELRRSATTVLVGALVVADARAKDMEGWLRSLRLETSERMRRASEAGDNDLARLWRLHEERAREDVRRWCLGIEPTPPQSKESSQ